MLARTVLALALAVRVYDNTGLPAADRAAALAVADGILKQAGIAVLWRGGEDEASAIPEVILRIVAASPQTPAGSLGSSLVDVERRIGTLGTVFSDRVAALAAQAGTDASQLLGRAMAHEVGHLLVGTTRHADHGLMRSLWTSVELQRNSPRDWMLSPEDVGKIRRGLVARTKRPEPPGVLAAERKPLPAGS